jgi:hypothetical protein
LATIIYSPMCFEKLQPPIPWAFWLLLFILWQTWNISRWKNLN